MRCKRLAPFPEIKPSGHHACSIASSFPGAQLRWTRIAQLTSAHDANGEVVWS